MQLAWIDIFKGMGILFVVFGHMTPKGIFLTDLIFLFHMPLFFFVSGYLFKPSNDLKTYAKKKAIQLLIPYLSFLCILYLIPQIVVLLQDNHHYFGTFKEVTKAFLIGGRDLRGIESVFWFVTCLFATQQLINWLVVKTSRVVTMGILFCSLVLSYLNARFNSIWLPLDVNVALAAAPIFYLGFLYKGLLLKKYIEAAAFLFAIFGVFLLAAGFSNTYDMKAAFYGIPFITLMSALAIIVVLMKLCRYMENIKVISLPLIKLGQAELTRLSRTLLKVDNTTKGGVRWARKYNRSIQNVNGRSSARHLS